MKACLTLFLVVIWAQFALAQSKPETPKSGNSAKPGSEKLEDERKRRELAVHNLIVSARAHPVEAYADVVLSLLDGSPVMDRQKEREVLEELFREAENAKEALKMRHLQGQVDTRSGYRAKAFELRLNALSIKLRVIRKMLALDKARAREMFRSISPLKLTRLTCKDDLGYDVAEYYSVLRSIFEETFDPEARRRREPVFFAATVLAEMDSPAQVGPAVDFLTQVKTASVDFGILVDSFNAAVAKIGNDPRSFAKALKFDRITEKVSLALLPKLRDAGIQRIETIKAYRTFVSRNLSTVQCADSLFTGTEETPHPVVQSVNLFVEPPIDTEESKPETTEPRAEVFAYWRSPKAGRLLADVKRLRFGDGTVELGLEVRSDQAWQERLLKFLERLDDWKPEDEETPEDHLHQKSVLYNSLFELVPPGQMRSDVLNRYSLLLRDSPLRNQAPAQWLHYVKMLLRLGKQLPAEEQPAFIERLVRSGCDVCGLYRDVENLKTLGKSIAVKG